MTLASQKDGTPQRDFKVESKVDGVCYNSTTYTSTIHVYSSCTYMSFVDFYGRCIGKYTSPMDGMGYNN